VLVVTDAETKTGPANLGVKKGLPSRSLKDAEANAAKVWEVARRGTAKAGAIAAALKLKGPTGGGWDRNIALLRAFGFVKVDGDDVSLTELGIDAVQDADVARRQEARRMAFFKVRAYSELVDSYDGDELPPTANIASKLRFDYGKTEEMATQAAEAFVESLRHAGLLDGTVVRKVSDIHGAAAPIAPSDRTEIAPDAENEEQSGDGADEDLEEALDAAWEDDEDDDEEQDQAGGTAEAAVSLSITLDLSSFRADEVIEILRALGVARR
jgi:hypothetical protein